MLQSQDGAKKNLLRFLRKEKNFFFFFKRKKGRNSLCKKNLHRRVVTKNLDEEGIAWIEAPRSRRSGCVALSGRSKVE